jgi:hypothetical protein
MEGNLDWRSFGSITYNEMKEVGLFDRIKKKISIYKEASFSPGSFRYDG